MWRISHSLLHLPVNCGLCVIRWLFVWRENMPVFILNKESLIFFCLVIFQSTTMYSWSMIQWLIFRLVIKWENLTQCDLCKFLKHFSTLPNGALKPMELQTELKAMIISSTSLGYTAMPQAEIYKSRCVVDKPHISFGCKTLTHFHYIVL